MGENMETEESGINLIDLLLKVVEEQNNSIEDNARALSRDFWTEKLDNNDKGKFEDRGHLGCRIRVKGEGGAVYAEWYKTIWIKKQGAEKAKPWGKYIKKGKRDPFGYNIETLKKMAKPIEKNIVVRTEEAFRILREQNHCLTQLKKYGKQLEEANAKWEALSEGE